MKNSEKREKQISRLVDILGLLSKNGRGCSRQFLADEFDVRPETISRDIAALVKEFPVRYSAESKTYRFEEGFSFKDIDLSSEEIRALLMCRIMTANLGDSVSGALDSLMRKLKVELGHKNKGKLEKISTNYSIEIKSSANMPVSQRRFEIVQNALDENLSIKIIYRGIKDPEEVARIIDPYGFFFRLGMWHVVGHCHDTKEINAFALDKISDLKLTDKSYRIPPGFSVDGYLSNLAAVRKEEVEELQNIMELIDARIASKKLMEVKEKLSGISKQLFSVKLEILDSEQFIERSPWRLKKLEESKLREGVLENSGYAEEEILLKAEEIKLRNSIKYKAELEKRAEKVAGGKNEDEIMRELAALHHKLVGIKINKEMKQNLFELDLHELTKRRNEIERE